MKHRLLRLSPRSVRNFTSALVLFQVLAVATASAQSAHLVRISSDPFSNSGFQHATEVEPDTFAFGSTMVATFQQGRRYSGGGASDIGFATATNNGTHLTNGSLPGITTVVGGNFQAASDPSVAYDSAHGVWLIASLGINSATTVLVSRSTDGGIHWNNPVTVNDTSSYADKDWIVCDNNSGSPFLGHCYIEWDDAGIGGLVEISTSTDGGLSWSAPNTSASAYGLGGQPVVQPNGTVIMPFEGNGIQSIRSTNGGQTWSSPVTVSSIYFEGVGGELRTSPLPSAEIDGAGRVYVAWEDCRFRSGCSSNDIVFSSSSDGVTWSAVTRVPTDPVTSTIDHFIPGLAVDPNTTGANAHLALTFYAYSDANCNSSTCKLYAAYTESADAGKTWTHAWVLAGPMNVTWLANTDQGYMVGDYISTSFFNDRPFGVFAKAVAPVGGKFNEAMYTALPLAGPATLRAGGEQQLYFVEAKTPLPEIGEEDFLP